MNTRGIPDCRPLVAFFGIEYPHGPNYAGYRIRAFSTPCRLRRWLNEPRTAVPRTNCIRLRIKRNDARVQGWLTTLRAAGIEPRAFVDAALSLYTGDAQQDPGAEA